MGLMKPEEYLTVPWYAVVDDLIGGWAVSNVNKTTAEMDFEQGEIEIASFASEEHARHIAELHNRSLESRLTS